MVINGQWNGRAITLSIKNNCLTLSTARGQVDNVYSYDPLGRIWTAMIDGISYRRGLDGKVVAKWLLPNGERTRRWLSPSEADDFVQNSWQTLTDFAHAANTPAVTLSRLLTAEDLSMLATLSAFTPPNYQTDIRNYHKVYKPIGILPPDQYMALVLQATEGCSFNTCSFCTFYRDRPFRIKSPAEFFDHIHSVKDFLAAGLPLRRTIFLGDANALVIPMPRLLPLFEQVNQTLDVEKMGGIFAFLDGFSGERKSAGDYAQLAQLGLKRIYIGAESGNADLLRFLKKPGNPHDVVQAVHAIKAGGVAVGIIILLGAGGQQYARKHISDTITLLNSLPLDAEDLIYFSELIENEQMEYAQMAFAAQLKPLTSAERLQQAEQIESALRFTDAGGTPHISRYDIREFVY